MNKAYIVCGTPGSGKSTYGRKLAEQKGALFLDIDSSSERLVRLALKLADHDPEDRDSPYFKKHFREPIYQQMFDIARDNLTMNSVVIVGPFTKEIQEAEWPQKLSLQLGSQVEIHYVFCPPHIRKKRLLKRANSRDQAKLSDWANYLQYYKEEASPVFDHVSFDNSEDEREQNL